MNKLIGLLAGLSVIALPSAVGAQVQINYSTAIPVPSSNDFQGSLSTLGLTRYTAQGATMVLASNSTIFFEFLGSESEFSDTFTTGPVTYTENSSFENHFGAPIALGSANFLAGSLAGLMTFTSSGGVTATVGHDGFGIFLRPDQVSGQSFSTFYLGYDDQVTNQDDNHDDFIVRATVRPAVPEPATWAMMLVGFGAMGVSLRRRRRTNNLLQAALGKLRSLKGSNLARLRPFCCPVRWVPRKLAIVRFGWNADVRKLDDVIATNASVGA